MFLHHDGHTSWRKKVLPFSATCQHDVHMMSRKKHVPLIMFTSHKKIHRKHDKSSWAWWLCWRNSYASGVCNIIKRRQIMVSPFKMNVELKQYGIKVGWGFVVWYSVLYMLRVMSRKNMSFASRLMTYFFCSWHSAYTESHITPLTPSYLSTTTADFSAQLPDILSNIRDWVNL